MNKLSVLIFSKGGIDDAVGLIKDISTISDDIVIISGSTSKPKSIVAKKVRNFYMVPLGYADPDRAYGIKKCKNNWILHIDTDERLSGKLKQDIGAIIKNAKVSAFGLKRVERTDRRRRLFTFQIRLFRKDKVSFNGVIHNFPIVNGKTSKLDSEYFLEHDEDPNENNKKNRYLKIEAYTRRLSYRDVLNLSKDRRISPHPLNLYIKVKNANLSDELTKSDYNSFLLAYSTIIYFSKFSKSSYIGWSGGFRYTYDYNKRKIDYFFSFTVDQQKLQFKISQGIVRAGGVIQYLRLDRNDVVELLNRKFRNSRIKGTDLFVHLLSRRYENGADYFKKL